MNQSYCKDCEDRHAACHDTCERYKAWKAEYKAEQAYTKEMLECGRCVKYDHYKDMRSRTSRRFKPKTYWADSKK